MRQLVYELCYTRNQILFYLWRIKPILNCCLVSKYYFCDCLKICLWLFLSVVMIHASEIALFWLKNKLLSKKATLNEVEGFQICISWPKAHKPNSHGIWNDCDGIWTHNHLLGKRILNYLAKLTKWLSFVVSTYLSGAFDCVFLSCHICFLRFRS